MFLFLKMVKRVLGLAQICKICKEVAKDAKTSQDLILILRMSG